MGRKHPLRRPHQRMGVVTVLIRGLPRSTCEALDALDVLEHGISEGELLTSGTVSHALTQWRAYTHTPGGARPWREDGSYAHNAFCARGLLDEAIAVLDARTAKPLWRLVVRMDRRLVNTTSTGPPSTLPWWAQRGR